MPRITNSIEQAVLELQASKAVAIPTETVYGLAAMINKPAAIKAVFAMKNRPLNHPLIVHIGQDWNLMDYIEELPDYAQQLINLFWPGPLTLVFKSKQDKINSLVTGGQSTVAIRCLDHIMTQEILRQVRVPLVAPSANPFGKISPTTAEHVKQSFPDKNLLILDGGRCNVGIESTIIDATQPNSYQILRHGLINESTINELISTKAIEKETKLRVPGKLDSHYQPQKTLYYFDNIEMLEQFCQKRAGNVFVIAQKKPSAVDSKLFYPLDKQPQKVAYDLYYILRQADASQAACIAIELPPSGLEWLGVKERILKAGVLAS